MRLATAGPTSSAPDDVSQAIRISSARHGVSPALVEAVAWQESRFDPRALSPKGAAGVMQLMPATAAALRADPWDLAANIDAGAAYLSQLLSRFEGDLRLTLAAYNAGPAAVERHHGVPPYPETQAYVRAVLGRLGE